MKFTELNLPENVMKGVEDVGFTDCMPVQELTFVETFKGRDVLVQSQTGSGKTAAFLISIYKLFETSETIKLKRALIIVPTRELAIQIEKEAKVLGAHLPYEVGSFYGGVGYDHQEDMLERGVQIMVGTPGRLMDFGDSGKLRYKEIGVVVIDEADRLFDMGFYPDIRRMMKGMVPAGERITMLYSATINTRVHNLCWEYMHEPAEIVVTPDNLTVDTVEQELYHVTLDEKFRLLLGIMNRDKPKSVLIFTNMKRTAEEVAWRLEQNGWPAEYIMGDLPQSKRIRIIEAIKSGKIECLVATDVAARGLHINDLELVVNYDLPEDKESYVHRIGRTARAGKHGKAITLADEKFVYGLEAIEEYIGKKIPVTWHEESMLAEDCTRGHRFRSQHRDDRSSRGDGRGRDGKRGDGRRSVGRSDSRRDNRGEGRGDARRERPHHEREEPRREPVAAAAAVTATTAAGDASVKKRRRRKKKPEGAVAAAGGGLREGAREQQRGQSSGRKQGDDRGRDEGAKSGGKKHGKKSLDDRLDYYREKYGEDFKPSREALEAEKKRKKGLLERIKGIFKKN